MTRILPALRRDGRRTWRPYHRPRGDSRIACFAPGEPWWSNSSPTARTSAEHYAASDVAVAPLFAGGGTKLKVIEAFGYRRPVVSTGEGVSGLLAVDGEHYVRAETSGEFAAAIAGLAEDPERARRLAEAGRQLCVDNYALD